MYLYIYYAVYPSLTDFNFLSVKFENIKQTSSNLALEFGAPKVN